MLNFNKKGVPIARIEGGIDKNKIVYLDTSAAGNTAINLSDKKVNELPKTLQKPICEYCKKSFYRPWELKQHQLKSCKIKQFKEFNDFIEGKHKNKGGKDSEDSDEEEGVFDMEIEPQTKSTGQELVLNGESKLIPLPRKDKREILYVAGPQDSGKSFYCAQYLKEFKKIFKKRDVIVFSRLDKDKSLDDIKGLKRIELNEELLDDPISLDELKDSVCLFDDIENSQDKEMQKYLEDLRNDVIQNGRDHENEDNKDQIYVICTNHQVTDFQKTRDLLNECTSITIFPQAGATYGITRALKFYCGLSQKDVDKILKLPSRWCTIYKRFPMYCIYEKGAFMLSKL